jgi:hypothetical protein
LLKYVRFVSAGCHLFLRAVGAGGLAHGGKWQAKLKCQSPNYKPSPNDRIEAMFAGIPVAFLATALPFDLWLVCSQVLGSLTCGI